MATDDDVCLLVARALGDLRAQARAVDRDVREQEAPAGAFHRSWPGSPRNFERHSAKRSR